MKKVSKTTMKTMKTMTVVSHISKLQTDAKMIFNKSFPYLPPYNKLKQNTTQKRDLSEKSMTCSRTMRSISSEKRVV